MLNLASDGVLCLFLELHIISLLLIDLFHSVSQEADSGFMGLGCVLGKRKAHKCFTTKNMFPIWPDNGSTTAPNLIKVAFKCQLDSEF